MPALAACAFAVALLSPPPAGAADREIPRSRWTAEQNRRVERFRRELMEHPLLRGNAVACADASLVLWDPSLVLHPTVVERFERNPEKDAKERRITYREYRRRIGLDGKIRQAPEFFERYQGALVEAEQESGVSRYALAAVIGIETEFGRLRRNGGYRAVDALLSQYVLSRRPARRRFAVDQMANLLVLRTRLGVDIFTLRSSYAGAIGYAQGIPSSLNRFYRGDLSSMEDSIDFVARYLSFSGWKGVELDTRRNRKALYSFNHSENYVRAALEIAASLAARDVNGEDPGN